MKITDKMRLDWLTRNIAWNDAENGYWTSVSLCVHQKDTKEGVCVPLRKEIDRQMKGEKI